MEEKQRRKRKRQHEKRDPVLRALSHPLRRSILLQLRKSPESSPLGISKTLEKPLSNVSYHFRVLAECEAVSLVRTKPVRGSVQHFYSPSSEFMAHPAVEAILSLG